MSDFTVESIRQEHDDFAGRVRNAPVEWQEAHQHRAFLLNRIAELEQALKDCADAVRYTGAYESIRKTVYKALYESSTGG